MVRNTENWINRILNHSYKREREREQNLVSSTKVVSANILLPLLAVKPYNIIG